MTRLALASAALLLAAGCRVEHPPYGGQTEQALVAATLAADPTRVGDLLKAGADPNRTVAVNGDQESAWYLALTQLRANRPETIQIVTAMIAAGASPSKAWGTSARDPRLPRESFWRRLSHARTSGTGNESALELAMAHPVPEVIRALTAARFDPHDGESALVDAIESGDIEIAHILVEAGVDVNCHPGANTPLVAAVAARNLALVTYLEQHGAREKP